VEVWYFMQVTLVQCDAAADWVCVRNVHSILLGETRERIKKEIYIRKVVASVAGFAISGVEPVDSTATLLLKYYHL
jgi:hypothetical protein